jgi:hypothetical protein
MRFSIIVRLLLHLINYINLKNLSNIPWGTQHLYLRGGPSKKLLINFKKISKMNGKNWETLTKSINCEIK